MDSCCYPSSTARMLRKGLQLLYWHKVCFTSAAGVRAEAEAERRQEAGMYTTQETGPEIDTGTDQGKGLLRGTGRLSAKMMRRPGTSERSAASPHPRRRRAKRTPSGPSDSAIISMIVGLLSGVTRRSCCYTLEDSSICMHS